MTRDNFSPLDELDETVLFGRLGKAWLDQHTLGPRCSYSLDTLAGIGRAEFEAFADKRRYAIELPLRHGRLDHMNRQIKMSAGWAMPANIVLAIVDRRASLGLPENQASQLP